MSLRTVDCRGFEVMIAKIEIVEKVIRINDMFCKSIKAKRRDN